MNRQHMWSWLFGGAKQVVAAPAASISSTVGIDATVVDSVGMTVTVSDDIVLQSDSELPDAPCENTTTECVCRFCRAEFDNAELFCTHRLSSCTRQPNGVAHSQNHQNDVLLSTDDKRCCESQTKVNVVEQTDDAVNRYAGYIMFARAVRREIRASDPEMPSVDVARTIWERWTALSNEKKISYDKQALLLQRSNDDAE